MARHQAAQDHGLAAGPDEEVAIIAAIGLDRADLGGHIRP